MDTSIFVKLSIPLRWNHRSGPGSRWVTVVAAWSRFAAFVRCTWQRLGCKTPMGATEWWCRTGKTEVLVSDGLSDGW